MPPGTTPPLAGVLASIGVSGLVGRWAKTPLPLAARWVAPRPAAAGGGHEMVEIQTAPAHHHLVARDGWGAARSGAAAGQAGRRRRGPAGGEPLAG